jgi:hypothetical protein
LDHFAPDVDAAIASRMSVRAYLERPVESTAKVGHEHLDLGGR